MQVRLKTSQSLCLCLSDSQTISRSFAWLALFLVAATALHAQPAISASQQQFDSLPSDPSITASQESGNPDGDPGSEALLQAPGSQTPAQAQHGQPSPTNPTPVDTPVPVRPSHFLTLNERFRLQAHTTFSPEAVVLPAFEAAITMAHPPRGYSHEWSDGGGAFARNYGSTLGGRTTGGMTHFAAAWIDHEDPRYFRSLNHHAGTRVSHAIVFTFFDRANPGHRTIAMSNFAAAAASGFICNLWQPDGFNDTAHALQRSERGFAAIASANIIAEFSPELSKLMHKAHLPDSVANAILPRSY